MVNLASGAIPVPAEFFGLASQDWPSTGSAPTFPFGRLTSYDNNRTHWRSLHTATNTINWAALDTFVSGAKGAGAVRGTYVVYGCPTFLASTGAAVAGPYGGLGEGAHPNNLAQLTYFCQQFAARNASNWGKFFDVVSLFNEPGVGPSTAPSASAFEWSTENQFVDKLWTAYTALKTADASLLVLTPGYFRLDSLNDSGFVGLGYLATVAGAVNTTKTGLNCYDGLSSHPYEAVPAGSSVSGRGSISSLEYGGTLMYGKLVREGKAVSGPIHITEWGFTSGVTAALTAWLAKPAVYRESFIQCLWIDAMLAGVKSICPWSYGNVANLSGNLTTDDPGSISGMRKIYNACVGKTIIAPSGITPSGGRYLTFSDGSTYSVPSP